MRPTRQWSNTWTKTSVGFGEKSPLAAIPTLGDVMGITGHDETWHSGHYLPPCKSFNRDEDITRCRSIDER